MKTRIQLYTDEEMKRRIELAAGKYNMPVTQYCYKAVTQFLAEDDLLEKEKVTLSITKPNTKKQHKKLFAELRVLHRDIAKHRQGKPPIDVEAILDEMHEEREHEILGMY